MKRSVRTATSAVVLGVLCLVMIELLVYVSAQMLRPPLDGMENQVTDLAFQVRKTNLANNRISPDQVCIIDIDDASIAALGRSQNWPRSYDARIINYISSGNPAAIGIDYLYTEKDSLSQEYTSMLEQKGFSNASEITKAFSSDNELKSAIQNSGKVYLSFFDDDAITDTVSSENTNNQLRLFHTTKKNAIKFHPLSHVVLPVKEFASQSKSVGAIAVPTMYDGTVRYYRLLQQIPDTTDDVKLVGNFPLYMMMDALNIRDDQVQFTKNGVQLGDSAFIPLRPDGSFRINWLGKTEKIRYISYYKVLDELVPAEYFENKFVFLGTSASGLQDLKTVPSQENKMPGVQVHAVAFLNMMNGSFLREITEREAIPGLLVVSIFLTFVFLLTRPLIGFFLAFLLYLGERFLFELWVMPVKGIVFPITSLLLLTLLTYLIASLYTYFIRERKNRILKNAFGTYVSPEIVEQIAKDPEKLQLGGEKKELTVLFSDIRSFTSYSEKLDPQQIVAVLNNYLSAMSETIFRQKGTIDKFIGDAIMAIFGAPIAQKDHAQRACRVALDMMRELKEVNAFNAENGYPPLRMGIGVNTGDMTVGNIGSEKRFDYTVIGDSVNLGSRVEGLTKFFKVDIIVSEMTKIAANSNEFAFRELGSVIVKGKDHPIKVYELLDPTIEEKDFPEWFEKWNAAFEAMHAKNLSLALSLLEFCESLRPRDFATLYYTHACKEFLSHPEDFSFIITMDVK